MSGKYDESVKISHEEEGTYHRREVDYRPRSPVTTHYIERYQDTGANKQPISKQHTNRNNTSAKHQQVSANYSSDENEADNFEEWTTSKRKVNHKTRQVETRVSRKLLVRGGEVIADSGPQVTTRIKEDNKVEECEKEKAPKNKGRFEALESAPEAAEASGLVLGEKKEIQRKSREVREENMQYHDERFEELTGKDVHRRAIKAPHELITINDQSHSESSKPRGKMIHYSNKGKKYQDTDEILEVAKLAIDGSITKEVKRTKHHEEFSEDELPDEKGEAEELRRKPIVERSSRRHADYVNDFDQVDAEPGEFSTVQRYDSDGGQVEAPMSRSRAKNNHQTHSSRPSGGRGRGRSNQQRDSDEAFPRYEIDPLLNSLRDEDFKPKSSAAAAGSLSGGRPVQVVSRNRGRSSSSVSSSDHEDARIMRHNHHQKQQQQQPSRSRQSQARQRSPSPVGRVEVPEEYRVNKQRLMSSRSGGGGAGSNLSSSLSRGQNRRREDAATQARLTDEEVERQSQRSHSPSLNSHEKTTKYLQRQSTPNSSRHYYYGDSRRANSRAKTTDQKAAAASATGRRPAADSLSTTSSSTSLSSLEQLTQNKSRKQVAHQSGRDSGFKSPMSDKYNNQHYSNNSNNNKKHAGRAGAVSPGGESLGQRSVKTTTTTMSAGLTDRPLSRADKENRKLRQQQQQPQQQPPRSKSRNSDKVSKPSSPFQRLSNFFAPSKNKPPVSSR